ncbi:ABC transporter ATP-binding protein [Marinococcus luteus]|uniref:ABC transporter ATP-binding protein n=1 Tax=Marinococcus luteus TaxID=1122204 RepID=UPI002ACCD5EA|nr:ATP-binding cassette domain-containing protein [Marinococcus luteus]MDZ5784008.1 ATP-binding cassette domain-containing protein [Marinococcus luteus]
MLEVNHLSKRFLEKQAVDELSFSIQPGESLGLIGQNGAGKTTTFRMLLGLMERTDGMMEWQGKKVHHLPLEQVGYLPEERGLFAEEQVEQQLQFLAGLKNMNKKEAKTSMAYWLEVFELEKEKKQKLNTLSKGNQQKIQLIAALVHHPDFLILDEPFSGLDPVNTDILKEAIQNLRRDGVTIIFSSHRMEHVEEICDKLVMLKNGRDILSGRLGEIKERMDQNRIVAEAPCPPEEVRMWEGVREVRVSGEKMHIYTDTKARSQDILQQLFTYGDVRIFRMEPPSLEEIFKEKIGESDA